MSLIKEIRLNYKLALILTPAVFMLLVWILVLSNGPLVVTMGITKLLLIGAVMSFGISLSIAIFIKEVITV